MEQAPNVFEQLSLRGKTALVTGAGSGLGWAFAQAMAEAGADVVCADLNDQAADRAATIVSTRGQEGLAVRVDVTDERQVQSAFVQATERFGQIHVVLSNAGIGGTFPALPDLSLADWNRVIAVNQASV